MVNVHFTRRYAMAHRLIEGTSEKCAVPHGHNERVTVELEPLAPFRLGGANAIAPFETLKATWHGWIDGAVDHALQLNAADPLIAWFAAHEPKRLARIMVFPGDPTTEALAILMFAKLSAFLAAEAAPFRLARLSVEETPTNRVSVDGAFMAGLDLPVDGWFRRADRSINDFPHTQAAPVADAAPPIG